MRRAVPLGFMHGVLFVVGLAAPSGPAWSGPDFSRSAALPPDDRLRQTLTDTPERGSASETVAAVSTESKVKLSVDSRWAQERLLVVGKPLSVAQFQSVTAHSLGLSWKRSADPPVYRLALAQANRDARELALAQARRRGMERLRERWELMKRAAKLSPNERTEFEKFDPLLAKASQHPRSNGLLSLVFSLPENVLNRVFTQGRASVAVPSLDPELQEKAVGLFNQSSRITREQMRASASATLYVSGTVDRPTIWMDLMHAKGGTRLNVTYAEGWARQPPGQRRKEALRNPSPTPADPRFKKRVTLLEPCSRRGVPEGERPKDALPLLPFLRELQKQTGLTVVAASDYRPRDGKVPSSNPQDYGWLTQQWWLDEDIKDQPLATALDLLCADFEYEWHFRNGVIALRHRRWYVDAAQRDGNALQ